MDPITKAIWLSWDVRIEVIAVLGAAGTLYTLGWRHLRRRRGGQTPATGRRLTAYLAGLLLVAVALMSPIDVLGGQLFYMHMIQHLLLVMFAPPLLLLANPFPFILWGLPSPARAKVAGLFNRKSAFRATLRSLTPRGPVWMLFIAVFIGWHDPNAYNAALRHEWVHDLEHITFFGTAMLYWWHVIGAGPRLHGKFSQTARIAYLLITVPVNMLAGVTIAFSNTPIYTYYTTVPHSGSLNVMEDQMLGGLIMWIPGSMMYILAALILFIAVVRQEERRETRAVIQVDMKSPRNGHHMGAS